MIRFIEECSPKINQNALQSSSFVAKGEKYSRSETEYIFPQYQARRAALRAAAFLVGWIFRSHGIDACLSPDFRHLGRNPCADVGSRLLATADVPGSSAPFRMVLQRGVDRLFGV